MYDIPFLDIPPLDSAQGTVRLPGSKSISNRVLLLAALCEGSTEVRGLLDSDDTQVMVAALRTLGCRITFLAKKGVVSVQGIAGKPHVHSAKLFLGNAGTAMRSLVAALAFLPGEYELCGTARMHERPIADLVDALRGLGCLVTYLGKPGFPPLVLGNTPMDDLPAGSEKIIQVRGDVSSQFLTALLMALPLVAQTGRWVVQVQGDLISKPYVAITLKLLADFGVEVQRDGWQRFVIPAKSRYQSPQRIDVEPDASAASYFIAMGALAAQEGVSIEGLGQDSMQGDIRFAQAVQAMGSTIKVLPYRIHVARGAWPLKAIDLDCNHIPDAAMTLAVMALFAQGKTYLRNIASWRVKETDRLSAMAAELRKLGAAVEEGSDYLGITPPASGAWQSASIYTYDDHRMAMCFSLAAFNPQHLPVRIEEPKCVAKTFPDYFETFFALAHTAPRRIPVIAIDGPSASGKGSLASALARALGFHYLDSGALYRLTALAALHAQIALDDEEQLAQLAAHLPASFDFPHVYLHEKEVGAELRQESVGNAASAIAALPKVRTALLDLQRRFRQIPGLVCDGRDMGSVVFPDAALKIFLNADVMTRAQRRFTQIVRQGGTAIMSELVADLQARDQRDRARGIAPLMAAKDASLLDNSLLSVQDTLGVVLSRWHTEVVPQFS